MKAIKFLVIGLFALTVSTAVHAAEWQNLNSCEDNTIRFDKKVNELGSGRPQTYQLVIDSAVRIIELKTAGALNDNQIDLKKVEVILNALETNNTTFATYQAFAKRDKGTLVYSITFGTDKTMTLSTAWTTGNPVGAAIPPFSIVTFNNCSL